MRTRSAAEIDSIVAVLRRKIEVVYGDRLRGLYLYGSYARGEAVPTSDLDLLVVLDRVDAYWDEIKRTSHMRAELSLEHEVGISLVYVAETDWRSGATPFLLNVREEGRAA